MMLSSPARFQFAHHANMLLRAEEVIGLESALGQVGPHENLMCNKKVGLHRTQVNPYQTMCKTASLLLM